jgi:hypothetical protein
MVIVGKMGREQTAEFHIADQQGAQIEGIDGRPACRTDGGGCACLVIGNRCAGFAEIPATVYLLLTPNNMD